MSTGRTVEEKIADWWTAYQVLRDTITPEGFRQLAALASGDTSNTSAINIGLMAARIVFANDRAVMMAATMMTTTGVKPASFDFGEDG